MQNIIRALVPLVVALVFPPAVSASTIVVSPNQSIQTLCADPVLEPGDICLVNPGTYEEIVTETSSGSSANPIKYLANGHVLIRGFNLNGNHLVLNGFTVTPTGACQVNWNGAIQSSGSNNLITKNTVIDSIITGLKLTPTARDNIVSHNTIKRANVDGLSVGGANHLVEYNDISDIRNMINQCCWWNDTNAITFFGSGSVYRHNHIHHMVKANQCPHPNFNTPHVDGFQTHSSGHLAATNTIIEKNHIFMGDDSTRKIEAGITDAQGFHAFMIEQSDNLVIKNNLIESRHGLNIGGGEQGDASNLQIYHNLWRGDPASTTRWPTGLNLSGVNGYRIYNNVLIDFMYSHITVKNNSRGGSANNNLFWNSNNTLPSNEGYTLGSGDKNGIDPKFTANFTDYRLRPTSPAVDHAYALELFALDDYSDTPRPQGIAPDIGPFELSSLPTKPGDLNGDNVVNLLDFNLLISKFGNPYTLLDFNAIIGNYGQ